MTRPRPCIGDTANAATIADFRPHDTRLTFASRLAMEGGGVLTIKDLAGWKSSAMVQRHAHLSQSHRNHAIECLVSARRPPPQRKRPERRSPVIRT